MLSLPLLHPKKLGQVPWPGKGAARGGLQAGKLRCCTAVLSRGMAMLAWLSEQRAARWRLLVPGAGGCLPSDSAGEIGIGPGRDQPRMGDEKSGCWNRGRSFCIIQENATELEIP